MTAAVSLRLLRIVAAYLIASLVTGYVVYASLFFDTSGMGTDARNGGLGFGLLITFFVACFAASPAALTVAVGEVNSWRSWWYYGLAGSLIGLVLGFMFKGPAFFPYLGLVLGVGSGAIYWKLAGQMAGLADDPSRRVVALLMFTVAAFGFFWAWSSWLGLSPF
jgi:hypothetical protein